MKVNGFSLILTFKVGFHIYNMPVYNDFVFKNYTRRKITTVVIDLTDKLLDRFDMHPIRQFILLSFVVSKQKVAYKGVIGGLKRKRKK